MVVEVDVVFENGVLRPVEPLALNENQRLHATLRDAPAVKPYNPRKLEQDWLDRHGDEYRGQWVALEGEVLLSAGTDAQVVLDEARAKGIKTPFLIHVETALDRCPSAFWI